MGQYTNNGLLNGYKKNNSEREELDYYATPGVEVENILDVLGYDFSNKTILEPCIGGGHMAEGIENYIDKNNQANIKFLGTDVQDRGFKSDKWDLKYGFDYDFLNDDYPNDNVDIVIMNPPYATLEPFLIRALEIAQDKLIVLCRTQVLEGASRYENVFINNPPTAIYQYVDRIQCWKSGVKPTGSSAQAYCWLVWDKDEIVKSEVDIVPKLHWIRRSEKY